MAVKVYIRMNGEKGGGTYEVDKYPIEKESGLLPVIYTPSKGKKGGQRIPKMINIANISEIEPVDASNPNYDDLPNE